MTHKPLPLFCALVTSLSLVGHAAPGTAEQADDKASSSSAVTSAAPAKAIELPAGTPTPLMTRQCSPENPRIGTQVSCLVRVEHAKAFSVSIVVPPGFTAEEQTVLPNEQDSAQLVTTRQVSITPLSMRKLKLFGFSATWSHESGAKGTVVGKDEFMTMASMMGDVDEPSFRTFRAPAPDFDTFWSRHGVVPLIQTNWYLMIGLMVTVLGGFLALIITYVQKVRAQRRKAEIPWVDPRPAHVIANESLEALSAQGLPEQGLILEFYLRLSEILRVFLENRFGIAIERGRGVDGQVTGLRFTAATTEEIQAVLGRNNEISEAGLHALMECLGVIDYVVFGGIRPHVGQTEADRRRIRNCIGLNKRPEPASDNTDVGIAQTLANGKEGEPKPLDAEALTPSVVTDDDVVISDDVSTSKPLLVSTLPQSGDEQ